MFGKRVTSHYKISAPPQNLVTFLIVSLFHGFPSGKETYRGQVFASLLIVRQINAETTHWNHVTNKGASNPTILLDKSVLFTNTVMIEIILWQKKGLNVKISMQKTTIIKLFLTNKHSQQGQYEYI